jgi:hypothetical protein
MSNLKITLAMMVGAYALAKAKEAAQEKYPTGWSEVSVRMDSIRQTLAPFKDVKILEPFTFIAPVFSEPQRKTKANIHVSSIAGFVEKKYNCCLSISDPHYLLYNIAKKTFENYIIKMGFKMSIVPSKDGNWFVIEGAGKYKNILWLASRYASTTEGHDGWYYHLESVYQINQDKPNSSLTIENVRLMLYPPNGGIYKIIPQIYKLQDEDIHTWISRYEPGSTKEFYGKGYSTYKASWTNYIRNLKPYNIFLYGKPGCGKTSLLKSWFYEENVRVIRVEAADLVDNIRAAFAI